MRTARVYDRERAHALNTGALTKLNTQREKTKLKKKELTRERERENERARGGAGRKRDGKRARVMHTDKTMAAGSGRNSDR